MRENAQKVATKDPSGDHFFRHKYNTYFAITTVSNLRVKLINIIYISVKYLPDSVNVLQ